VKVVPSNAVALVTDPPPFVPVTYVAKAPISNSFGLKNETGGGGGGATTSLEETSGPPNADIVCDIAKVTAKAIDFFILDYVFYSVGRRF
jgi:hypothetical protein